MYNICHGTQDSNIPFWKAEYWDLQKQLLKAYYTPSFNSIFCRKNVAFVSTKNKHIHRKNKYKWQIILNIRKLKITSSEVSTNN